MYRNSQEICKASLEKSPQSKQTFLLIRLFMSLFYVKYGLNHVNQVYIEKWTKNISIIFSSLIDYQNNKSIEKHKVY